MPAPPGFKLDEAPTATAKLPPGFRLDTPEPQPAAVKGSAAFALDPMYEFAGNDVTLPGIVSGIAGFGGDTLQALSNAASWAEKLAAKHGLFPKAQAAQDVAASAAGKDQILTSEQIQTALQGAPKTPVEADQRAIMHVVGNMFGPSALEKAVSGAIAGSKAAAAIPKSIERKVSTISGSAAKKSAEALRGEALARAEKLAAAQEAEAAQYAKRLASVERAQGELAKQPQTAEARAERQALKAAPFAAERERVLADLRERAKALEQDYRAAGFSTQAAERLVAEHDRRIAEAEAAVERLEKEFLAKPGASADQFGAKVRQITGDLAKKYGDIRRAQSGYAAAIDSAGASLRVETGDIQKLIDAQLKDIRNPALERALLELKNLLQTSAKGIDAAGAPTEKIVDALTLKSADSLRGFLDSILQSKTIGDRKIDRETLHFVGGIKKELVRKAVESWQPYREALAKWRTLSRPLDIVERKGALKPVIDTDPVSTDFTLTEAQVVGRVIGAAKAGNPVFTRLLAESPELRDAARLYFTQDLFGKETVPTEAALRTWLKANEAPLKQLGLYGEFRDMRAAKETAQRAVDAAKDARKESVAQVRAREKSEREIADKMRSAERLREAEKARIAAAEKAAGSAPQASPAARTREAANRLEQQHKTALAGKTEALDLSHELAGTMAELRTVPPAKLASTAQAFAKRLHGRGLLTTKDYETVLSKANEIMEKYAAHNEAKRHALRRLVQAAGFGALLGGGWTAYHLSRVVF